MRTAPKRATSRPQWRGERAELLVQEPGSQLLRVAVFDIEMLNVKVRCMAVCRVQTARLPPIFLPCSFPPSPKKQTTHHHPYQELLRLNLLKGARELVRTSRLIGRASVPIAPFASAAPRARREVWVPLTQADWADDLGLAVGGGGGGGEEGGGCGEVKLALTYAPLSPRSPDAPVGAR